MKSRKAYSITWGRHRLDLGRHTAIMGIVNVTPDSFSDGGRFLETDAAVAQGLKLAEARAHILDIGGESTRPYAEPVSIEEEIRRVVPVIQKLAAQVSVPISIDTTKAEVARAALTAGAAIINDISALRMDPQMVQVAAQSGVPLILMHMQGEPQTMQVDPQYDDVLAEVAAFLQNAIERAAAGGVVREKIIIDPGIGFGKNLTHNLLLLKHLDRLQALDLPILVGVSRKAFIRNILKAKYGRELQPDQPETETGTQAAVAGAILHGAHVVRVHDVYHTAVTAEITDAIASV